MRNTKSKLGLSVVEAEYVKVLKPELQQAIKQGEPERAASFAKALARLQRKTLRLSGEGNSNG